MDNNIEQKPSPEWACGYAVGQADFCRGKFLRGLPGSGFEHVLPGSAERYMIPDGMKNICEVINLMDTNLALAIVQLYLAGRSDNASDQLVGVNTALGLIDNYLSHGEEDDAS